MEAVAGWAGQNVRCEQEPALNRQATRKLKMEHVKNGGPALKGACLAMLLAVSLGPVPAHAAAGPTGCKDIVVNGRNTASPQCLSDTNYKSCEAEVTRDLALEIERMKKMAVDFGPGGRSRTFKDTSTADSYHRTGVENAEWLGRISAREYALAKFPVYDLKDTRSFIASWKSIVAALKSGDEDRMSRAIGVPYRGRELEMRLAGDERFLCLLNVRLTQLTGKPPAR
jgi:hypothetical protein